MKEPTQPTPDTDAIARLIHAAGTRAPPPQEVHERTLTAARLAWRRQVQRRRRRLIGLAASVAVLIAAALLLPRLPFEPDTVARPERIVGTVQWRPVGGAQWSALTDESRSLTGGGMVRTHAGSRAGLLLHGGVSLRLAEATWVTLESPAHIRLHAGRIYLDTDWGDAGTVPHRAGHRIEVRTPAGTARDVGTQFEVSYLGAAFNVRVRAGEVLLRHVAEDLHTRAGEQITIDAAGRVERSTIAPDDPHWQWVYALAPAPELNGRTVQALLEWVRRETGKALRYATPEARRRAETTILHGHIRHLAPLQALEVMLATTDLEHLILEDGTILVRLKPKS